MCVCVCVCVYLFACVYACVIMCNHACVLVDVQMCLITTGKPFSNITTLVKTLACLLSSSNTSKRVFMII